MQRNESFAVGQRWLSNAEAELGLGIVVASDNRRVDMLFPSSGESRVYAQHSAPLTRIRFDVGDTIRCHEGWQLQVGRLQEEAGVVTYAGVRLDQLVHAELKETQLSHHFELNQPQQRLLAGQLDDPKWFDLREQCIGAQLRHATSPLLGFVGARVDLIPHQLHIAAEVGQRHAPRVLLADEVGLGKTIEAALIIHQQLLTNRAQRVLIVVPDSLVHQWLVEMLRRVNLAFAIFDAPRCQASAADQGNPFDSEQLVLCSLDFLLSYPQHAEQASSSDWDLLVIDEAHHLTWSEHQVSAEYALAERLAQGTKGLLLLTATPDQLGHESHFARLRLLDPARFHDYPRFLQEERGYARLATAIGPLLADEALNRQDIAAISAFAEDIELSHLQHSDKAAKQRLIRTLLDRHGTSRVLFRNSRSSVAGFPKRKLHAYPLAMPSVYAALADMPVKTVSQRLSPERHTQVVDTWQQTDPRIDWLIAHLLALKGKKVLTICTHASTALQLVESLRVKAGIRASAFHEGMSIVERDRAANYFAQLEEGAQVLICSEIGSEGRNFQFAHHLVMFDLPLSPDLLEQRIGRLDRIGQSQDVNIHVPYFAGSAQQVLFDWFDKGLNAFTQTCPVGAQVFEQYQQDLFDCMQCPDDQIQLDKLLVQTSQLHRQLRKKLEQGRDKLLEINSSGRGSVEPLLEAIKQADESPRLETFMGRLFDALGIWQEDIDQACYVLRPTESMLGQLPGLEEEGMTITYERATATQLEDVHFFSWDHPMIQHAMDMLTTDVLGKSAIGLCADPALPAGSYWLECLYVLSAQAPAHLQLPRFLPPTPIRLCLDGSGTLVERQFIQLQAVKAKMAQQLVQALRPQIEAGLAAAQRHAERQAVQLRDARLNSMRATLNEELTRLTQLQAVNPSIRDEELEHLRAQSKTLETAIQEASVQLEALRLVVNNP